MRIGLLLSPIYCLFLLIGEARLFAASQVLATARLRLPYGESMWPLSVQPARTLGFLQVGYMPNPSCPALSARVDVQDASNGKWQSASYSNGYFQTPKAALSGIRVIFTQLGYQWLDCQLTLTNFSSVPGPQPPIPGNKVYAGLIDYKGGFNQNLEIALKTPYYAQDFELLVPQYCLNVELINVAAQRLDKLTIASKLGKDSQVWHLPKAGFFDHLRLDLNGPIDASCQIPVYVYDLEAESQILHQ